MKWALLAFIIAAVSYPLIVKNFGETASCSWIADGGWCGGNPPWRN